MCAVLKDQCQKCVCAMLKGHHCQKCVLAVLKGQCHKCVHSLLHCSVSSQRTTDSGMCKTEPSSQYHSTVCIPSPVLDACGRECNTGYQFPSQLWGSLAGLGGQYWWVGRSVRIVDRVLCVTTFNTEGLVNGIPNLYWKKHFTEFQLERA